MIDQTRQKDKKLSGHRILPIHRCGGGARLTTYEKPRRILLGGGIEPGGWQGPRVRYAPRADASRLTTRPGMGQDIASARWKGVVGGHIYSWDDGQVKVKWLVGHTWSQRRDVLTAGGCLSRRVAVPGKLAAGSAVLGPIEYTSVRLN